MYKRSLERYKQLTAIESHGDVDSTPEINESETVVVPPVEGGESVVVTEPVIIEDVAVEVPVRDEEEVAIADELAETESDTVELEEDHDAIRETEVQAEEALEEVASNEEVLASDESAVAVETFKLAEASRKRLARRYKGTVLVTEAFANGINDTTFSTENYRQTSVSLRRERVAKLRKLYTGERIALEGVAGDALVKAAAAVQYIINAILNALDLTGRDVKKQLEKVADIKKNNTTYADGKTFESKALATAVSRFTSDGKAAGEFKVSDLANKVAFGLPDQLDHAIELSGKATLAKIEAGEGVSLDAIKSTLGNNLKSLFDGKSIAGYGFNYVELTVEKQSGEVGDKKLTVLSLSDLDKALTDAGKGAEKIKSTRSKLAKLCNDRIAIAKAVEAARNKTAKEDASGSKEETKKMVSAYKESRVVYDLVKDILRVEVAATKTVINYVKMSIATATAKEKKEDKK